MDARRKVFGIGFHKTATTSLANALYVLGYNVTGYFGTHDPDISKHVYEQAYSLADRFDAAQDIPWPILYKELDQRYPGSKFILTIRPDEKWIASVVKHFKDKYIPAHEWIYGVRIARGNEDVYLQRYREHNREVREYFKDRPNDLLVMDITAGDRWNKLCPFLGLEIPPVEFPLQNTAMEKSHQIPLRAMRYLKRNLFQHGGKDPGDHMATGVSSAFVRDILHYHFAMFDDVWEKVNRLSDVKLEQKSCKNGYSLRDLLFLQTAEEILWLKRLNGEVETPDSPLRISEDTTKDTLYQLWNENRFRLRQKAANLSDEDCNAKVTGSNVYVWEVFFHLVDYGARQHTEIVEVMRELGIEINAQSFLTFFRKKDLLSPQPLR
jgi:hypothetical protein